MSTISGKVVIITGASSGLGAAIALLMAEKGARLTLCGRNKDNLDAVLQKCSLANDNHPERLFAVTGDVTSAACRKEMVQSTIEKFGKLDVLIPNAGIVHPDLGAETATEETYDKVMDTNLKSIFFLIQEAIPYLQESKGAVVCMSSVFGSIPTTGVAVYAMAKAALDHLIRCLALSLGPKGIRVNGVKPSFIPTQIARSYPNAEVTPIIHAKNESPFHPLEGRCCTPEEIAEATLFLASSGSSFITGECVHVDGGRRFFPG